MREGDVPGVGWRSLDAVLRFLPIFKRPNSQFSGWNYPEGRFPYLRCRGEVDAFVGALYKAGMIFPFDWSGWQAEARRYLDPGALETAGTLTLRIC